ncbi:uncharacterized protein N7511_001556 [Penicillium nucicola]|uniref:uncharacterized protein n=1 Tax=Penicillium nucicola TaxID=1850975 RepID=UPI0025450FBE|nr:uncharacterized protein N7511_001556 [Penicillium nucicola]KAJ5776545.1 hypothetical protein N7511_001556 [Penicillium nucicola]
MDIFSLPGLGMCILIVLWVMWGPRKWLRVMATVVAVAAVTLFVGSAVWANIHKLVACGGYGFAIWGIWSLVSGWWAALPTPVAVPPPATSADLVPLEDFKALEVQLLARDQEIARLQKDRDTKISQLNETIRLYQKGVLSGPGQLRDLEDQKQAAERKARHLAYKVDVLEEQVKSLEKEGEVLKARIPNARARWEHPVKSGVSKQGGRHSTKGTLSHNNKVAMVDSMWSGKYSAIREKGLKDLNLVEERVQELEAVNKGLRNTNAALKSEVDENVSLRWYQEGVLQKAQAGNREKDRLIQQMRAARQQNMGLTNQVGGRELHRETEAAAITHAHQNEIDGTRLALEKAHKSALASQACEHEQKEKEIIRKFEAEIAAVTRNFEAQNQLMQAKLGEKQAQGSDVQSELEEMTRKYQSQTLESNNDLAIEARKHEMENITLRAKVAELVEAADSTKLLCTQHESLLKQVQAENQELRENGTGDKTAEQIQMLTRHHNEQLESHVREARKQGKEIARLRLQMDSMSEAMADDMVSSSKQSSNQEELIKKLRAENANLRDQVEMGTVDEMAEMDMLKAEVAELNDKLKAAQKGQGIAKSGPGGITKAKPREGSRFDSRAGRAVAESFHRNLEAMKEKRKSSLDADRLAKCCENLKL